MTLSLRAAQTICDRDIIAERWRQLRKWGHQKHPDVGGIPAAADAKRALYDEMAWRHKRDNDLNAKAGTVGWDGILLEEVYEALAESERDALRAELVQVAAVCVAWVEDLDNRAGDRAAVPHPLDQELVAA